MKSSKLLFAGILCAASAPALAVPVNGTGNVTPEVIFGSGNANGSFTGATMDDVEVALRAKLRFNNSGAPENTFNYDGDRTYTFDSSQGVAPAGAAIWSFDFSINVDPFDTIADGDDDLDDLTYVLSLDLDPSAATNFFQIDPINVPFADHAIGTNATANGDGIVATDAVSYADLIANNNVAQNSVNYGFLAPLGIPGFDPNVDGTYTIGLEAFFLGGSLASTSIDVVFQNLNVAPVPLPAGFPLLLAGLGGFAWLRRSRRRS